VRVAVVCPYDLGRAGGVQHQTTSLVRWLLAAGHEAWLVGPGEGPPGARRVGRPLLVPLSGTRAPLGVGRGLRRAVAAAVDGADVVHVHEPFMPQVSLAALMADTPPRVGTFHADPPGWARVGYRGAGSILGRLAGRLAAATAVSPVAASAVEHLMPVTVVPNGIDLDAMRAPVERREHRVAFVGRDEPRKGLDVLLEAWAEVRRRVPDAELLCVGPDRVDVPPGVRMLGRVPDEEKAGVLSSAAVFCAPNLGGESFGIVLVEAMAAGAAVVASGLRAFVDVAGDAGTYTPPGDAAAVADAVAGLLVDDDLRRAARETGTARASAFSGPSVAARYAAVYATVAG
jgi:phosphatidyl-myo-inositol alpha-mannosyltransferase